MEMQEEWTKAKLKVSLPCDPALPLLNCVHKGLISDSTDPCSAMFMASLFTITKQRKGPLAKWRMDMWYIDSVEYYSDTKKTEITNFAGKCVELGKIDCIESKTQTQKH